MKYTKYQLALLEKHRLIFELLVTIANQSIRQEQLTKILVDTGYCSKSTVTRILQDFKNEKLILVGTVKKSNKKIIEATTRTIKFIEGEKANKNKIAGANRELANAMALEFFYLEYVEKQDLTLDKALEQVKLDGFNLFQSSQRYYDLLNQNNLAYHSLDNRASKFYKQEKEMQYRLKQQREHIEKTARTRTKGNETNPMDRRTWVLDDLKLRKIYFKNLSLTKADMNLDWIKYRYEELEDFEPLTLTLNFVYFNHELHPNEKNIYLNLIRLYKFIKKSFYIHEWFFIRDKGIKRAFVNIVVNVEVFTLNQICFDNLNQEKINWKTKKRLGKSDFLSEGYRYDFNVSFSHLNINHMNEHLD